MDKAVQSICRVSLKLVNNPGKQSEQPRFSFDVEIDVELVKLHYGVKGVLSWHESHNYWLTGISWRLGASHRAGALSGPSVSFWGLHHPTFYSKGNTERIVQ